MSSCCQRFREPRPTRWIRRPSSSTGVSRSRGVIRPVRPILNSTARTSARALAKGYFQATAQFGGSARQRCGAGLAPWRMTMPSLAKGRGERYQRSRQAAISSALATGSVRAWVSARPIAPSPASRAFMSRGPSGQSQTNRPMAAASRSFSSRRLSSPATLPRAPWPPCLACTWPSRRQ
ncbi:hypothetical protein D9M70_485490 [compost metagenome]